MSQGAYPSDRALLLSLIQAVQNLRESTHNLFATQEHGLVSPKAGQRLRMDWRVLEMILDEDIHPDLRTEVLEDQIDGEIALIDWDEIPRGDA